ncbi:MAG: hypothetical protein NC548_57165, partial [Lachnospiraceae bacterium]|nr:hypothetical protein [Lachnospiraceae bacterium]
EAEAWEDDSTIITPAKLASALSSLPQGNYSNVFSIETSTQLDEQHLGSFIFAGGDVAGVVITLPQSNAAAKGKKITITANRAGITINPYEGDHIRFGNFGNTENGFFLPGFSVVSLVSNGNRNWTAVSEVPSGLYVGQGYRVYPDGYLEQWGYLQINSAGPHTVTFPVPFSEIFNTECSLGGTGVPSGGGPSVGNFTNTTMQLVSGTYGTGRFIHWRILGRL